MSIPNLHDRRALEEIVAQMDTEAIVQSIREGGLSAFAEEAATDELARRVLAEEVDFGPGARGLPARVLDRASRVFAGFAYLVWFAWVVSVCVSCSTMAL